MTFDIKQYITENNDALKEASPAFNGADFADDMWTHVKKLNLNGWKLEFDMSGAWMWYHPRYKNVYVHATPFWEGTKGISVQVSDQTGDMKHFVVPFKAGDPSDKSPEDQLKKASARYATAMKQWFQKNLRNIVTWDKEGLKRKRGMEDNPFQ